LHPNAIRRAICVPESQLNAEYPKSRIESNAERAYRESVRKTLHSNDDHVWVTFVETELLVARTFCHLAETKGCSGRLRCTRHARTAFNSATRFMLKAKMSNAEFAIFSAKLEEMKFTLEALESQ